MESLQHDDIAIPYEVRGSGGPVVLIHGACGQVEIWGPVTFRLSEERRVIAYDRRGYGRSQSRPTPHGRLHVEDAVAIIEDVAGGPAMVVGWSTGGSIALGLAVARPDLVRALVVIEPFFHMLRHAATDNALLGARIMFARMRRRAPSDIAEAFGKWVLAYRSGGTAWDELSDELREIWGSNGSAWLGEPPIPRHGLTMGHVRKSAVAECGVPLTCLLGAESIPMFSKGHRKLAAAVPHMRTVTVPGATHMLPVQAPDAVVDAVLEADARASHAG